MRLTIATPDALLLEQDGVVSLRAEDESGTFGIMAGHVPFLTALTPSVVSWRDENGREKHCAVRGGLLTVRDGQQIAIATRQAFLGDDIARLEDKLRAGIAAAEESERTERVAAAQMQAAAIRRIMGLLRPGLAGPGRRGAP
ncbi:F0F1 ATP synthase subunit epsilon [Neoroseomonas lacus]|uniref:ATP synthase epsilon chain n=1 Tax=Neoroseomonas lacus TaxID=287609 RepID=A0A917NVA1_9PROT|nr:F0F1 ATP synthase subunit epsilon [Neoroseomonas lacus]GGJ33298.1 ATP synthase epsilon chain [Neoroseomonas lacus]